MLLRIYSYSILLLGSVVKDYCHIPVIDAYCYIDSNRKEYYNRIQTKYERRYREYG